MSPLYRELIVTHEYEHGWKGSNRNGQAGQTGFQRQDSVGGGRDRDGKKPRGKSR